MFFFEVWLAALHYLIKTCSQLIEMKINGAMK